MFVSSINPEHEYPNTTKMRNNSKQVKDIFIIVKAVDSKIHMGQDNLIYYHAYSFQSLSRFWFQESILVGCPLLLFLGIMKNAYICYIVFIIANNVTNVFL